MPGWSGCGQSAWLGRRACPQLESGRLQHASGRVMHTDSILLRAEAKLKPKLKSALATAFILFSALPASAQTSEYEAPDSQEIPVALMVDLSSGQTLFARDPDRRFMPASVTKVMTTFLAFELIDEGKIDLAQIFTMSSNAFDNWHRVGSTMFLDEDARVTVDQLIHGVTTVSANDGSVVLAEGAAGSVDAWTNMMNAKAAEIGMQDSRFYSPNGFPDEGRTFVSANDLVRLASALIKRHPEKFRHFVGQKEYEYDGIAQFNHDPLIGRVEGADGIKTGFTNEAGYTYLGTAQRGPRRLAMVVAGADRASIRNRAAISFMEWGFDAFESRRLFENDEIIAEASLQNAEADTMPLKTAGPLRITVPKGSNPEVGLSLSYEGPLRAPVQAGEKVAQLEITIDGMEPFSVPLFAAQAAEKASFFQRIANGISGLFA